MREKINGPRGSLATVPLVLLIKGEPRGQGVVHVSTLQQKGTRRGPRVDFTDKGDKSMWPAVLGFVF